MSFHDALAEHMRKFSETPFKLNVSDCGLYVADWVHRCTGIDPFSEWRGDHPKFCGEAVLPGNPAMVSLVHDLAKKLGLVKVDIPERGDIGAFMTEKFMGIGIFTGTAWSGKTPNGIFCSRYAKTIDAYQVPHV
jgi:hypothetical protein